MSPNSIPFYISKSSINSHTSCTYLMFSSCIKMFYFHLDTLYLPLLDVFLLYQDDFFFIWTPCTYPYLMFSSCIQMFSFLFGHPVPTPTWCFLLYQGVFFFIWTPCTYTPTWCFPPVSRCSLILFSNPSIVEKCSVSVIS